MKTDKTDIHLATRVIIERDFTPSSINLLNVTITQNAAAQLVANLIQNKREAGKSEEDAVSNVMLHLESLGNVSKTSACILMAHLWPLAAGDLYLHQVCDAIDLWMDRCKSSELARQLKMMVSSESDSNVRRHYEAWLHAINGGGG